MTPKKLFTIPNKVNQDNIVQALDQAIQLELATIPTYLSTYYSIQRTPDQQEVYDKILGQLSTSNDLDKSELAHSLTLDVMVYSNKAAALIMSVVIEEMLHLSLSSNVKQAFCKQPPKLMEAIQGLEFPTALPGHEPSFPIHAGKLSIDQLITFLQIESPNKFPKDTPDTDANTAKAIDYTTIGEFYTMITEYIENATDGYDPSRPQLTPDKPYYSQNTINTVYYDRNHEQQFTSGDDSGDLIKVKDTASALAAIQEVVGQGEGFKKNSMFKVKDGKIVPLEVKPIYKEGDKKIIENYEVVIPEDEREDYYDDKDQQELSHFAKFMEAYSLGLYHQEKFKQHGLDDFFSYFVYNQPNDPKTADYDDKEIQLLSHLGNAMFTYTILMVETCYYLDQSTQYNVFMYGIHRSMIWLLSYFGNHIRTKTFIKGKETLNAALTFEYYDFSKSSDSPKDQIIAMSKELAQLDSTAYGWMQEKKYDNYFPSLPDVTLDHKVATPVS